MTTAQTDIERMIDDVISEGRGGGSIDDMIESVIAETRPQYVAGGPGGIPGAKEGAAPAQAPDPWAFGAPDFTPPTSDLDPQTIRSMLAFKQQVKAMGGNIDGKSDAEVMALMQSYAQNAGNTIGAHDEQTTAIDEFSRGLRRGVAYGLPAGLEFVREMRENEQVQRAPEGMAGFAGETLGGFAGLLDPGKAPQNAAAVWFTGGLGKIAQPVIGRIASVAGNRVANAVSEAILNAGQGGGMAALEEAGKIPVEEWQRDWQGSLARIGKAAGVGSVAAGGLGAAFGSMRAGTPHQYAPTLPERVAPNAGSPMAEQRQINLAQQAAADAARTVAEGQAAMRDVAQAFNRGPRILDPNAPDSAIIPDQGGWQGDPLARQTFQQINETRSPEATLAAAREAEIRAQEQARASAAAIQAQEQAARQAQAIQQIVASGRSEDALGAILARDAEIAPMSGQETPGATRTSGTAAPAEPSPLPPVESMTRDALAAEARTRGVLPKGAPKKSDLAPLVQQARDRFERERIARRAAMEAEAQLRGERIQSASDQAAASTENPLAELLARRNTTPDPAREATPNAPTKEITNGQEGQGSQEGLLSPGERAPSKTGPSGIASQAVDSISYDELVRRAKAAGVYRDGPKTRAALVERLSAAETRSAQGTPTPESPESASAGRASAALPEKTAPAQSDLGSSQNPTRQPWEMTRDEASAAFNSGDPSTFSESRVEDWGRIRQQGKRSGGMVMGGMADPPRGKKSYTDMLAKLGLTDEQRRELGSATQHELMKYAKARASGFDHDNAMIYSYSDVGDPHRVAVENALREGRPVPPAVLADYPDLVKPKADAGQGAKQPWEMTRDEAGDLVVERHKDNALPNRQFETLRELENKNNGKGYIPDAITKERIDELRDAGLVSGPPKKPRITENGRSKLYDWKMDERSRSNKRGAEFDADMDAALDAHKEAVTRALSEGRPVPPEVLKDYPDLAGRAKPPTPAEPATTAEGTGAKPARTPKASQKATAPAPKKEPKIRVFGRPRNPPKRGTFTKADIEESIRWKAGDTPQAMMNLTQDDVAREAAVSDGGHFLFYKKLPGEVRDIVDSGGALKRLFRVTQDKHAAHGEEVMWSMGLDEYIAYARRVAGDDLEASIKAIESMGDYGDPEAKFLVELYKNLPGGRTPKKDVLAPTDIPTGSTFEINGEKFRVVTQDDGGYDLRMLKDGDNFTPVPIEYLSKVPVDKGTLKTPKRSKGVEIEPSGKAGVFGQEVVDAGTGRQNEMFGGVKAEPAPKLTGDDAIDEQIRKQYDPNATDEMFGGGDWTKPDDDIPFERKGPGGGAYSWKGGESTTAPAASKWTQTTLQPPPKAPRKATLAEVPIPTVELVKLSKMLLGRVPKLTAGGKPWWGVFRSSDGGSAYVEVTTQTAKDPVQLAKTLAHELGHAMDWLPDKTLARGNVLSRTRSESPVFRHIGEMNSAMKQIEAQSLSEGGPTHKALKDELKALTQWWKPFDEKADPEFTRYRYSAKELYADTVSVLLNDPRELKRRAPTFYRQFEKFIDRKPAVRDSLLTLQDLLGGTPEKLANARRADIREWFGKGEELMRARAAEREMTQDPIMAIRQALYDTAAPLVAKEARAKRAGIKIADEHSATLAMDSLNMADNEVHVALTRYEREAATPMRKAGVSENDLGEFMFLRRVTADRAELANPGGYTPETARQQIESLRKTLGPEKWKALNDAAGVVDDLFYSESERAARNGLYSQEVFDSKIEPNKGNYATFAVLNYLDDRIGAGVVQMDGTFNEIANPLTATMMKLSSLIRANATQEAKTRVFGMLRSAFSDDFHYHPPQPHAPGTRAPTPKLIHRGRELVPFMVDGKMAHMEVDPYTAAAFQRAPNEVAQVVKRVVGDPFYKFMHPLYVTFNPGWQAMNLPRDLNRTWKNLNAIADGAKKSSISVRELLSEYVKAVPSAWKRARGDFDPKIEAMLADKSLGIPYSKAVGLDDSALGRMEKRYNVDAVRASEQERNFAVKAAHAVFSLIEDIGNTIETLPKIAGHEILGRRGLSGERLAYAVRNYAGTPNTTRRGNLTTVTNSVLSYANVMLQGYRADAAIALGRDPVLPSSRSAWWTRSILTDLGPKMLMGAGAAGLLGTEVKEIYDLIPESDLAGYVCIPLGTTEDRNGVKKAVYLRIPHLDTLRPLMAATWMLSKGRPQDSFSQVRAALPSWNPMLESVTNWSQYAAGINPREEFRGRDIIGSDAFKTGGKAALIDMAKWQADQFGVLTQLQRAVVPGRGETGEKTWLETALSVPGIGSVLKVSNRGASEKDWASVDAEDAQDAAFRLSLPDNVTQARRELSRLERLGKERLDRTELNRMSRLKVWRSSVYERLTDRMKKSTSEDERDALRKALESRTEELAR